MPIVSVIICSYNRSNLLPKAIDSVLSQDYSDFELIIVDDASSDDTQAVIPGDSRIKYFRNESNLGISKSRNRGVYLATGDYIAMLDSDDYWIKNNKLSKQVAYLDSNLEVGLIGTAIRCEDENGLISKEDIFETEDKNIRAKLLWKNQFAQSSVLFRKDAFSKYDESLSIGEDYDLWLKIGCNYKLANLSEVTIAYLIHSGGITKQRRFKTIMATDKIVRRYKNNYPGYLKARAKTVFRLLLSL